MTDATIKTGGEWPALSFLAREIGQINRANGWREDGDYDVQHIMAKLMLIVTEVAEAAEELRPAANWSATYPVSIMSEDGRTALAEELADTLIRVLDLSDALGLDMNVAVTRKLENNKGRGHRHGGKML
jgi:NTP pyrophosphatase (non-canonical NTP hydrolase)